MDGRFAAALRFSLAASASSPFSVPSSAVSSSAGSYGMQSAFVFPMQADAEQQDWWGQRYRSCACAANSFACKCASGLTSTGPAQRDAHMAGHTAHRAGLITINRAAFGSRSGDFCARPGTLSLCGILCGGRWPCGGDDIPCDAVHGGRQAGAFHRGRRATACVQQGGSVSILSEEFCRVCLSSRARTSLTLASSRADAHH